MAGRFDETLQELNRKYGTELNSDSVRSAQEADRVKAESRAQNNWGSSDSGGSTFSGSRLHRNTSNQQSVWLKKYQGKGYKSLATALSAMDDGDEKKWLTSYAAQVDYDEKKRLDVSAYEKMIEDLQRQIDEYPDYDWTDVNQRRKASADIDQLQKEIDQRKQYLTQAKRIQEQEAGKARFEGARKNDDFAKNSGFDSTNQEIGYQYVNADASGRADLEQKYGRYVTQFADMGIDSMNDEERSIYNYYMNTDDREEAARYLQYLEETLQIRKGTEADAAMDALTEETPAAKALRYAFMANVGYDQHLSGMRGAGDMIAGKDAYVPPSATQVAGQLVREDLAQDGKQLPKWLGGGSVGQMVGDLISTTANMAPSMAVGLVSPGAGAAMMGASAAGSAYQEKLNEGHSKDQARKYGIAVGASETALGAALSGIKTLGGSVTNHVIGNALKGVKSGLGRFLIEFGGSVASEALEEGIQEILTPVFSNWLLNTDEKIDWAQVAYSALLGGLSAGVLEGPSAVANARNVTDAPNNVTTTPNNVTKASDNGTGASSNTTVSKTETVQMTGDIDSFARQFGKQAEAVKQNYLEGQDLQEYEVGFQAAFAIGREGGKAEALTEQNVPYLTRSQREIAFGIGRDAAMAEKTAEEKTAPAKGNPTFNQTAHLITEDGSDGGTVTIAEIESMDENGMTFRLDDGRTVTDEELDFPEGAEVYSAVMELGMDAESANAVVRASASATQPRAAVAEGIETAYRHGKYGYGMEALLKTQEAAGLPESVLRESYLAGEKYRQQSRETALNTETMAGRKVVGTEVKGNVYFAGDSDELNNVQRESLRGLEWIADLTGAQIYVEDISNDRNLSRINGQYDPADDSIHIDLRAGSDGTGTLLYTAAHEFTHRMKQNNEAAFFRLADFLVAEYGKKGITTDSLVKQQMADAAADGIDLNYDEAFEEMVSDAMEAMFTDTDALAKMEKLKTQDKSLWQEIKDFVLGLAEKIKAAYSRLKPDSAEARYVLQMKESLDQMAKLFAEGVMSEKTDSSDKGKGKVKYSFAGRSAATADQSALQQAEQMADQGIDNETIRQKTGWYKGMDGKWRYEIDDSQMEISENISNYMRLGDLMQHENLYAAYPDLADISVVFQGLNKGVNGSYSPQFDSIDLSYKLKNDPFGLKDALVHEIQHAIQHREGFTSGSTVGQWERKIKAGFDSRRAADIRKAQETERELRRIQDEEPEFYRDMVELDAMTPDLPRGKVDWETLEQIEEDPVEWQQYDARREELEAKYGDTKVWDMNDLLYQREKAAKNLGRTAEELYFDTAGEIEARDVSNRLSKSPEQRKSSPPRLGNEDTVFSEGSVPADDYIPGDVSDSELETGINDVAEMSPISAISGREFTTEGRTLLDDVDRFFKSVGGQVHNSRLGDINLTRRGVKDSLAHGMTPQKASAFAAIPDVLREGKVVGFDKNWKNRGYDSATVAAPITIGGEEYMMAVIVHRSNSANRFYVHDVFAVKKEATPFMTGTQNLGEPGGATSTISIIKKILSVKAKQTESKKKSSRRKQTETESLRQQNEKLQEDVERLQELVKLQGKVTKGKIMQPSSVEAAAKYLKKLFHTDGDTKELAKLLNDFYKYIASDPELTWEGVKEQAAPVVGWLQENEKFQRSQYAQDILDALKGQSFYLDETQLGEAKSQYGSVANYRRAVKNMASSKASQSMDQLWQELSSQYPDIFSPEISASDMPVAFAEAVERLEGMENTESSMDWRLKDQTMLEAVYDSYWRVSGLETVADKYSKKIFEIRGKHYAQMNELRSKRDKAIKEIRDQKNASAKKLRENRNKTEMRRKIRKTVMELDKLLNRGDKKKNVKSGMTSMVDSVLKLADALFMDEYTNRDMLRNGVGVELTDAEEKHFREAQQILQQAESGSAIEGMEFTSEVDAMNQLKKLDQKLSSKMADLKDVFARERKRLYGTTVSDLLGKLADEYSRLSEAEDGAVRAAKDENVYTHLLQLQKDVGGTTVRDMTLGQMEAVADAFTMVLTTVRNANKMFAKNLKFKRDTLAGMVMSEIGAAVKKVSKLIRPGKNAIDSFSWNNLKPVYAFERLGSETLKTLYQNIRSGQDVWSRDMQEADDFRREQYRKHNRKAWDLEKQHSFEFESGKVDLSLEQIMSLYAYSRREQALDHLLKGGFVFSGSTEVMVKEHGIQRRYLKKDATAYNLTADELLQVIDTLTKDQKAFVEEMQTYLSDVMGGKGNEISLQMYGIRSYGEKNYFPIRSAGQYMERAKEDSFRKEQGQISIVNSGFTKSTTPKANNPITLDGFMNVWAEHVNEMSMYHGFALPMEDFRRVYNYSSPNVEAGNSQSVNAAIENAFGKAATGYIDQLYKDLNGGAVSDNRESLSKKLVGLHKKAAVFASASVVIQQPSAIVRAFALIDPRHFIGPKVDHKQHKMLWEEVKKYAPVAFVKEMGYFDTGMGRSARDFLQAEEYSGIREKMTALFKDTDYRDEILGKAPALADELAWCSIWEAVKRETRAKNPDMDVRSDAFLKIAGDRFSEVIDKTQVYDSVLSRSANMRSKALHMNMLTSFLAEPTTSINMLEDAIRKGDRQQLKRTVGAVYGSVLLNSLLVSLVYAARDDDEDETWWEKYLSSVAVEMVDGINPITYYPFLRDIWSIGQGFDVERADMSLITDFADASKKVVQSILKVQQAEADAQQAAMGDLKDSLWGMADSVASLTGLPVKNIRRDISGAVNLYRTISADWAGRQTTALSLQDTVLADVMASIPIGNLLYSKNKREKLYDAIVAGDTAYAQRLKAGYDSEDSYHSAIKLALRDYDSRIWEAARAWNAGDMETYMKLAREIIGEGRFIQDDVVLAIRAEASSMEEKDSSGSGQAKGYFTAEKLGVAMGQNNTGMADIIRKDLIDTKMANGKSRDEAEESVESTARSQLKELYETGKITGAVAQKMLVRYGGYDRDNAANRVEEWKFETKYGFTYAKRGEAYKTGAVSKAELRRILVDVGGKTNEEADLQIQVYDWERAGFEGATIAAVRDYNEHCVYTQVPKDVYLRIRKFANNTDNDVDVNGKTVYYSAMRKIMAEIGSQYNLTSEQKYAVARSLGWSEKNIEKYKTW